MAKATGKDIVSLAALMRVVVEKPTLAAFFGNTHVESIGNYVSRGLIVKDGHGRFLLFESVQNVTKWLSSQASGRTGKDENTDLAKSNAELKESQKRLTDLRIEQLQGNLVSMDEIQLAWDDVALGVKQLFLAFPSRARFDLPHLTGADQKVLEKLAHDMLTETATEGAVVMPQEKARKVGRPPNK